jgi:hypothetical protein
MSRRTPRGTTAYSACILLALAGWLPGPGLTQPTAIQEPWVQVEMTLFTYENANLESEVWSPEKLAIGFPDNLIVLQEVADVLQLSDWSVLTGAIAPQQAVAPSPAPGASPAPAVLRETGPRPFAPADVFTLPDLDREAFHALPPTAHDFAATNRTLAQSTAHRIVYHNAWRQPLRRRSATPAIGLQGGREFGERTEVEGSVIVHAGNARDRLVLETSLWLTQFTAGPTTAALWTLPVLPGVLDEPAAQSESTDASFHVSRIIEFRQSREMRLGQFHYLDHPALGMLVQVTPWEVPPPPQPAVPAEQTGQPASQPVAP